jgi:citrate lyase beta subunit
MSLNHNQIVPHRHFYLGQRQCRSILLIENDDTALQCKPDALALCSVNLKARLETLRQSAIGSLPVLLCISANLDHDAFADKLSELMALKPDGLILADAKSSMDGERLDAMLRVEEALAGLPDGQTLFLVMLGFEAAGFAGAIALAKSSARIIALGQDSRAITNAIGARTAEAAEAVLQTCRSHIQLAGASAKIPVFEILAANPHAPAKQVEALVNQGFHTLLSDDPHAITVINTAFEKASGP